MEKQIVVVGGGPGGAISALTAKSVYPDKSVCLIRKIGDGVIPCAIPYMIHTMANPQANAMSLDGLEAAGVETMVAGVESLDPKAKVLMLDNGESVSFDRLVLATGSNPAKPPIPGIELEGVFTITKSLAPLEDLVARAQAAKNVVIVGGGFIGAEFADELTLKSGVNVHLVELMPKLLQAAFDDELCDKAQEVMQKQGVQLHMTQKVEAIKGEGKVSSVALSGGEELPAELVIIGVGGRPDSRLAAEAGLRLSEDGSIWVDNYMRTSAPGIFAVGDCALKRDFFTRKPVPVWLASTATAEARNAGTNIYGIRVLNQIQGSIAAFSTKLGDTCFASAGLTERVCQREGLRYVCGTATAPDRHPGNLPGATPMTVKLVFADRAGALLGGQVMGGESAGELVNVIALGIQKGVSVREMDMMQIATHPKLSAAPTVHPLVNAAQQALAKLRAR
ncbi:MAG: FAD-dependent oxidoreductase [Desulfarculaceae bacterium]|nr:FAD-dependent oxidoreductase [Desulfarculaceae bacterium]MCF8072605.1 FAD-dependent oxidoreductase [Desulfarculaceae bacterium]MCF8103323.1 FAD-dependent oxidoreductase [Desulfarculaceae bacterium]MCF8118222.1 FAD-dependent oxidoreductase [Desulfarculaceae bacterium]